MSKQYDLDDIITINGMYPKDATPEQYKAITSDIRKSVRREFAEEVYGALQHGTDDAVWKLIEPYVPAARTQADSSGAGYDD